MAKRLRELIDAAHGNYMLTAAPECPLDSGNFKMDAIILEARFDALFIQYYNNAGCEAGSAGFYSNYLAWEEWLKNTASKNAKLYVGLPGSSAAAGSGYVSASDAVSLLNQVKGRASFGGAS